MKIINFFLTLFNVSLRIFRRYDVVFLERRGEIGWEKKIGELNPTRHLQRNKLYNISYRTFGRRPSVGVYGVHGRFHPGHFVSVDKSDIAGVNIFKKGDKVEAVSLEPFGWEHDRCDRLIIGNTYIVEQFIIENNMIYMMVSDTGYAFHPNHFKKV